MFSISPCRYVAPEVFAFPTWDGPQFALRSDASGLKEFEDGWETGGNSFWVPNGQPLETN